MAFTQSYTLASGVTGNYWVCVQQNMNIVAQSITVSVCLYLNSQAYSNGKLSLMQLSLPFNNLTQAQMTGNIPALCDSLVLAYANTQVGTDAKNNAIYQVPALAGGVVDTASLGQSVNVGVSTSIQSGPA